MRPFFKNMLRILGCSLGFLWFSVIVTEVVNAFNLFGFPVKAVLVAGPVVLIYLSYELAIQNFSVKSDHSEEDEKKHRRILSYYSILLILLGIIIVISIPFVWFGTIKTLASMAR